MKVRVNIGPLVESVGRALPNPGDVGAIMQGLGAAASQYWRRLAQNELTASARDYVSAIQLTYPNGKSAVLELVGQLPNMLENGWAGGDMREWLLRSPKAKSRKGGGKYLIVPFRHGTPGTGGRNVGKAMPGAIYQEAKNLSPTRSKPGGKTQWGGELHAGNASTPQARKLLENVTKPWHQTSIYSGMVRKEKVYEKAVQSSYQTFRTISSVSTDPRSWYHPGIRAKRFAPRVNQHIAKLASDIVTTTLSQRMKK